MMRRLTQVLLLSVLMVSGLQAQTNLPTKYQIRKVMEEHRLENPTCYVCGTSKALFRQSTYVRYTTNEFVELDGKSEKVFKYVYQDGKRRTVKDTMAIMGLERVAKNLPVHHIKSQKPFPELAAKRVNLVTLCWVCHYWLGHLKGHYKDHDANLMVTIEAVKAAVASNAASYNSTIKAKE